MIDGQDGLIMTQPGGLQRLVSRSSLSAQLIFLTAFCLVITSAGAVLMVAWLASREGGQYSVSKLTFVLCLTAIGCIGIIMAAVRHLLLAPLQHLRDGMKRVIDGQLQSPDSQAMPSREWEQLRNTFDRMVQQLRQAKQDHEVSQDVLAHRTATVDRLLDFSQTIQGAGHPDQVLNTLSQFLEQELKLSGIVILSHEPQTLPPLAVRASRPLNVLCEHNPANEMDEAMCPCLRQNLPRQFRPDGSPVRCAIDASLNLSSEHPAYCIPFNVGRHMQVVVHMLLPIGEALDRKNRRQLAQTYVK